MIEISPMKSDRPNAKASSPEKPESKSMLGSFIEMLTGPSVRNLKLDEEAKQYIDSANFSQAEHFTNDMISTTLANREVKHTWW